MCTNAVVAAGRLPSPETSAEPKYAVAALAVDDGKLLWSHPLPAAPVPWGLALDHAGRVVVVLADGRVICYAGP